MKVTGKWQWHDELGRNIFVTSDGKRYGTSFLRTSFKDTEIEVRPPHNDGTLQGRLENLLDGMEVHKES